MKTISKAEAKAKGLPRYFTGKPCAKGHVAEKYVNSDKCIECQGERNKLRKRGKTGKVTKSKAVVTIPAATGNAPKRLLLTAADIEREPKQRFGISGTHIGRLHSIGREIRVRVEKLNQIEAKAVDMFDSISYLLREAQSLCEPDGFVAFKQHYCPELGRSRTYELLAIEQGRKTIEEIRAAGRERAKRFYDKRRPLGTDKSKAQTIEPEPEVIEAEVIEETPPPEIGATCEATGISIDDIDDFSLDDIDDAAAKFLARFGKERSVQFILELQRLIAIANEAAA